MTKSYKIIITGQVQGVGFRPYVYVLANQFDVKGSVSNNEEGVIIYASGLEDNVLEFYNKLIENPPRVSRILTHTLKRIPVQTFEDFKIVPSKKSGKLNLQLTPDFAICEDCQEEILNKDNRRYQYPFTTCINCGPRWAITKTFPFEREHTSMHNFKMCDDCFKEYTNPSNKRFHSQTNSCAKCGIKIHLTDANGKVLEIDKGCIFKETAKLIKVGNIVAIKNTGGYLLCCDASNSETIKTLRKRKNRPHKPFAILYPSLSLLKQQFCINLHQEQTLKSSESPIVIIPVGNYKGNLAFQELIPNLNQLGVMIPYTAILKLLADELKIPIVSTSGNVHGSPIISSLEAANSELSKIADYFLHHNLEISNPQDDSVVKYSPKLNHEVIFRRSRGYAPNSIGTYLGKEKILAMGSHLKSTIAFLPNDFLYLSQYLGNLDNFEVYNRFIETTSKFINLFEQKPEVILVDAHPAYQSTLYGQELARELGVKYIPVQHHKAHFAAVLGEFELFKSDEPILGVVWDGTGYGDDGQIWGGEFFKFESSNIERVSYFEYFDWLAGDKMSKEPRISLLALTEEDLDISDRFTIEELNIYKSLKKKNTLKTSSVGRLFDAVASLLNICHINTYEGEAAILLENSVVNYNLESCRCYCEILENGLIPTKTFLKNIKKEVEIGVPKEEIIVNFIYTLANLVFQMADLKNIKQLAFSGGVFQNTMLIDILKNMATNKYKLYFNRKLSPNDENIAFGQIMHYLHINKS